MSSAPATPTAESLTDTMIPAPFKFSGVNVARKSDKLHDAAIRPDSGVHARGPLVGDSMIE